MSDLDDLPLELFERILLRHLDLCEVIRLRAVCRRWCVYIDNFSVTSLFLSELAADHIEDKRRLVVSRFEQNFIQTPQFDVFFDNFGTSLLSHLQHFRAANLNLQSACNAKSRSSAFVLVLNSFEQLQSLVLVRIESLDYQIQLTMPYLRTVHIEELSGLKNLTLDAPRLRKVKIWFNSFVFYLNVVHPGSVESIELDFYNRCLDRGGFRNLRLLYCECLTEINENFLLGLDRLQAIHLSGDYDSLRSLHSQKERLGLEQLKIYYHGLQLGRPSDFIDFPHYILDETVIVGMIQNYWRLAEHLLYTSINYSFIEKFALRMPVDFWARFVNVKALYVFNRLASELQFLNFLTNFENLVKLEFANQKQSQQLFNHLPHYCQSVQQLVIAFGSNLSLEFVFKVSFSEIVLI